MMRYDDAPRTERAPTAPAKTLEIRVLRVKRLMNLSSGISVGASILRIVCLGGCFFTPNDLPGADVPSAIVAADHICPPFSKGDTASFAARGLRSSVSHRPLWQGGR